MGQAGGQGSPQVSAGSGKIVNSEISLFCRFSWQLWVLLPDLTQLAVLQLVFVQVCLLHLFGQAPQATPNQQCPAGGYGHGSQPVLHWTPNLPSPHLPPVQPTIPLTFPAEALLVSPTSHSALVHLRYLLAQELVAPACTSSTWLAVCCHG